MHLRDWPLVLFVIAFLLLWLALGAGGLIRRWTHELSEALRGDFSVVLGATLTLLGLIIGFTFSMATNRYDLRESLEASEANAIGTEYSRLNFLPVEQQAPLRKLLQRYTELRLEFYSAPHGSDVSGINAETDKVGDQMWDLVSRGAAAKPDALTSLAASGMNSVLDAR